MQRKYRHIQSPPNNAAERATAAALRYDPQKGGAPEVLAAGKGLIADKIITLGRENGLPIYNDPVLAAALAEVDPGNEIPPELYTLVAQVLAYIYRTYRQVSGLSHQDGSGRRPMG